MLKFFFPYVMLTRLICVGCLGGWLFMFPLLIASHAQVTTNVTPDGTLGTTVMPNGSAVDIDGGTRLGANLFHSFRDFTVGTGDTVRFMPPDNIENILSRVTGGEVSIIDGRLESTHSDANLGLDHGIGHLWGHGVPCLFSLAM